MVTPIKRRPPFVPAWQAGFLAMLPVIRNYARGAFRHLNADLRQDLTQEVVANALVAYVRLFEQGRIALAYPTILARFGIAQVNDGRRVGASLNIKDVSSAHCQQKKGIVVERLDRFDEEENGWREILVEDKRATPAELAASRIDFSDWLQGLTVPLRKVAKILSTGETTTTAAKRFCLSPGRISQIRMELKRSWEAFQGERPAAENAAVATA